MRISRVYTRVGDRGTTRLVGGAEVQKDDPRIEATGTVDELNAVIGLARSFNANERLDAILDAIQHDLFNVGADLSTPAAARWENVVRVGDEDVTRLEKLIDELNAGLPELREFILPGGGRTGSALHQCRTVCRRAERRTHTLGRLDPTVGTGCLRYLNRLSDLLFVLCRWAAKELGEPEHFWKNPNSRTQP